MSVNGKFDGIERKDLLAVADRFSIPRAKAALLAVKEAVDAWPEIAKEAEVPEGKVRQVQSDFRLV